MNVKQFLLGNVVGKVALSVRSMVERIRAVLFNPESAGTIANDHLAEILVSKIVRSKTVFIDIGAHIGSIMAAVQDRDSSISIVAIEAIPQKVENLRKKFPGCEIHCCAAGASEGSVSFFIHHKETGYSSLTKPSRENKDFTEITVPMRTLDDLISVNKAVDVIKIDVEGAELQVLKGSLHILTHYRPTIMFESGPDNHSSSHSKTELWQYLHQLKYDIYLPNRVAHDGAGLEQQGFIESHWYPRRTTNYFAIAQERRDEIKHRARTVLKISAN